jgi:hypothetical protein
MKVLDVECGSGFFSVEFSGENLSGGISASGRYASGVYFYRLVVDSFGETESKVENRKRLLFRKLKIKNCPATVRETNSYQIFYDHQVLAVLHLVLCYALNLI